MQQRITETLTMTLLYLKPLVLHNQISLTFTVYGTWASYLISLCIIFPICKLEVIIVLPQMIAVKIKK